MALIALSLGTTALSAQKKPKLQALQVTLAVPKREAFNRTMAAFIGEGLVVNDANIDAGLLVSAPFIVPNTFMGFQIGFVYRANILGTGDSSSIVVLSGTLSNGIGSNGGGVTQEAVPEPLTSNMVKKSGKGWWSPIARMAVALERDPSPP